MPAIGDWIEDDIVSDQSVHHDVQVVEMKTTIYLT